MTFNLKHRPLELLAPAGDRLCVTAAVENGADAVYFGLECGFNARARATNLHLDSLPEVMSFLHERGVRGYVTLNTLVFTSELAEIERHIVRLTEAGVDAVLVQDLGLVRLLRAVSPELAVHASTQMTLTSAECIDAIAQLGIERVVVARELSIAEIAQIRQQTPIELEVFAHGALCVAYSGQCLTSESLGGRSANRGQCAQACRLPYDLVCDGQDIDLGDLKYLLSPQDLAAYALVPDLMEAGVDCVKIEGRLKTPEYVANITQHYRRAIDEATRGRRATFSENDVTEMELSFSRGFSPGWLHGCDHKMLVPGKTSAKRGVLAGEIEAIRGNAVTIAARRPLAAGDGIVFSGDREAGDEQGGRVYEVRPRKNGVVELTFGHGTIDFSRLHVGQPIWKTDDPRLTARLRKTFQSSKPQRRVELALNVRAAVGEALHITATAKNGATCSLQSQEILAEATKHPLTQKVLAQQFGRLGGSVYDLKRLDAEIVGRPMSPLSVLGKLRHQLVAGLAESLATRAAGMRILESAPQLEFDVSSRAASPSPARLRILCRTLEQLQAAAQFGVAELVADFQDIRQFHDAVAIARAAGSSVFLATPRIHKPSESGIFRAMAKHGADGFLVRNLAGMAFCAQASIPFDADFSLNAANPWTVDYLQSRGARRITASYDLNRDQLLELIDAVPPARLEVVIHQHMPMFHMEHCVFCAVLSPGTNKTNCGRPCDVHAVKLRDRVGMEHVLHADVGCRNTLYNAVPQSAAEVVPTLLARDLRDFRVELVTEKGDDARRVISLYQQLLDGKTTGKQVWQRLRAANRVGVTRGTLEERRNPLAIL